GIGIITYLLSSITAFVVEGEMTETFRRRTMEKKAGNLDNHYIVCGVGKVGFHIVRELCSTQRPCVVVDLDREHLRQLHATYEDIVYLEADSADNDTLIAAGVERAKGIFAATDDDNQNLVISLTAKQLNPTIHVVARCRELKNVDKLKAAGADAVVSPSHIGGLRMASEMVRPTTVSFLDIMLRDKDQNLRVEEISVGLPGSKIADLNLDKFPDTLLLAVRTSVGWTYNPSRDYILDVDSQLVVMTTPAERAKLEDYLQNRKK
ncbi:MAG: TrkA family potassium uptake protein, partial [Planctomycetota bacterium]